MHHIDKLSRRYAKNKIYLKIRQMFKSCNIYSKFQCFCKSKFTLSKVILPFGFTFDNVNFDLRKRSDFK